MKALKSISFFRNWYDLAELQTDDKLRLAFYDAVMRYAFDGVVPDAVNRDGDKVSRAAMFAFLTVQPVLDAREAQTRGGRKPSNGCVNGVGNGIPNTIQNTIPNTIPNTITADHSEMVLASPYKEKRIEENRIEENTPIPPKGAGGAGCKTVTKKEVVEWAANIGGVPVDFAAWAYDELLSVGWLGSDGTPVKNWRAYFKRAWQTEQERRAEAQQIAEESRNHDFTEDDL